MLEFGREVGDVDYRGKPRVQTMNDEPSMTIQSDAHLADIENILASYGATGMQQLDEAALEFRDVSDFTDLADALNQARVAEVEFLKLPSKVREIFGHDVAVWLDTAHDKDKRDELVQAGFLEAPEEGDSTPGGQGGTGGGETSAEARAKTTPAGADSTGGTGGADERAAG